MMATADSRTGAQLGHEPPCRVGVEQVEVRQRRAAVLDHAVPPRRAARGRGSGRRADGGSRRSEAPRRARGPGATWAAATRALPRPLRRRTTPRWRRRRRRCARRRRGPGAGGCPSTASPPPAAPRGPLGSRPGPPRRRRGRGSWPRPGPWWGRRCRSARWRGPRRTGRGCTRPGRWARCPAAEVGEVRGVRTVGQDAPVHLGVQRLHPAPEHLGGTGEPAPPRWRRYRRRRGPQRSSRWRSAPTRGRRAPRPDR